MPETSTASTRASAALRVLGYALLFAAAAGSISSVWPQAACIGAAAALVAVLERRLGRRRSPVVVDAEKSRLAEAQRISLELSCDRAESVLESLREGVVVVDAGGEVVMANPAARHAMARPTVDPTGRLLWEVLAGDMGRLAKSAWSALREGEGVADDGAILPLIRYTSIECRERYYDLTAVPATSKETGEDFGTAFLLVDATRNHELQRLKDRFLSSVSHELRTPLTNICAYSEILRTLLPGESAEWPEFVRVIHEESVQLSQLVDGMFDFLQLESGEARFRFERIDGRTSTKAAIDEFFGRHHESDVRVECNEGEGAAPISVDRERFEQVCRNLLDNAYKFTPPGGRIRVSFGEVGDSFELRVEDSGPGVPVDARTAVFDKFTQLRDHMTDKPSGAGLGLATCRAIVARLGGMIWCEDTELGGACFVVRLPLAAKVEPAEVAVAT